MYIYTDMESIDALAKGIKDFEGGLLLISHDFRLLDQVREMSRVTCQWIMSHDNESCHM